MPEFIEVLLADASTWQPLRLVDPPATEKSGRSEDDVKPRRSFQAELTALLSDQPLGRKLHSVPQQDWSGGIGISYNAFYGGYARTPGYALAAGAVTQSGVQSRTTGEGVAFAEYGGHLWIATNVTTGGGAGAGKVNQNANGTATGANAFATSLTLAAGQYLRDLLVADDASGTLALFASSSDVDGVNGYMHKYTTAAGTWSSTDTPGTGAGNDFGAANGRNRLAKVYWRTRDGLGAWRMVSVTRRNHLSYTVPNGNPMTAAGWVEAAIKVDTAYTLDQLVAFRRHVFVTAKDNLFDITETGDAPGMTSYLPRMIQEGTGVSAEGLDGSVYMSVGRGVERIYVEQEGLLQENPGQCAPGWGTRAENEVRGYCTAMCVDQGWLVAAIYNPTTQSTYICYGKDRRTLGIDTPNPLVWHGPEVLISSDYKVTRMWTSGLAGDMRLWCTATSATTAALLVFWVSLPLAGSPVQDLVSVGLHRFATGSPTATVLQPYVRLEMLPERYGAGVAATPDQTTVEARGMDTGTGTKITVRVTADPAPGAVTWPAGSDVTVSPTQTITHSGVNGSAIWRRFDFFNPSGTATPPKVGILDLCRTDAWLAAPIATEIPLVVEYGDGVTDEHGGRPYDTDADTITGYLLGLTSYGRTTIRLANDERYTVKFQQVHKRREELVPRGRAYGKKITAEASVLVLAGPL